MYKTHSQSELSSVSETNAPLTIMVVDDDPVFRHVICSILTAQQYCVLEAENGLDGLTLLRDTLPDLILCDLAMPVLDGMEFVEEVNSEYAHIPLIVVSATEAISDVAKALRLGIKDFLPKPITDHKAMLSAIEKAIVTAKKESQSPSVNEWIQVDGAGELIDDQELHWHLEYLQNNPNAARELLQALVPEKETGVGHWKCSYRLLQSTEQMPLVFDYTWLPNGQFAFYLIDSSSSEKAPATTLLVRALFDDYVRNLHHHHADLKNLAQELERGIQCADCASVTDALFGIADPQTGFMAILPGGLSAKWWSAEHQVEHRIAGGVQLGDNCIKNFIEQDLSVRKGGKLTITGLTGVNFLLELTPL